MKTVRIQRLTLENFKCHRYLVICPNGQSMDIFGDNATGKTSVYDALTWLLFGKDSSGAGEKSIDIKPLDADGNIADHAAETSVEAVLETEDGTLTLLRSLREVWAAKRGSVQQSYEGNRSEYAVDGVPCKKIEFDRKVQEIVEDDVWKRLTSVSYVANEMPWSERRCLLFNIAGRVSDTTLMAESDVFAPLVQQMGTLSLEDYKKKLCAEKKRLSGVRTELPARISECQKSLDQLAGLDFASAREAAARLEERRGALTAQLAAMEHSTALEEKRNALRAGRMDLRELVAQNETYRAEQQRSAPDAHSLRRRVDQLVNDCTALDGRAEAAKADVKTAEAEIAKIREQWIQTNNECFTGGNCPTCGQTLPLDQLKAATDNFARNKADRLAALEALANRYKQQLERFKSEAETALTARQQRTVELEQAQAELETAQKQQTAVSDMPDFAEKRSEIEAQLSKLESELATLQRDASAGTDKLRQELKEVNNQLWEQQQLAAQEANKRYVEQRIDELRENALQSASALEAVERQLILLESYQRYKAKQLEESVNSHFRQVRFRLFREQANGGLEERCDVTVNGVPYSSLNNGARINAGIDIINTLSAYYGVAVPLFIDNAESVTKLLPPQTQVIRLIVSENDKELRCETV